MKGLVRREGMGRWGGEGQVCVQCGGSKCEGKKVGGGTSCGWGTNWGRNQMCGWSKRQPPLPRNHPREIPCGRITVGQQPQQRSRFNDERMLHRM